MTNKKQTLPEEAVRILKEFEEAVGQGNHQMAEMIGMQFLAHASAEVTNNEQQSEWLSWRHQADEYANAADWANAERCQQQAIEAAITQGHEMLVSKARGDLSKLYLLLDSNDEALAQARLSVECIETLANYPLLAMAHEVLVWCHLRLDDSKAAILVANEAVDLIPDTSIAELMKGRALVMRARCQERLGHFALADADLKAGWDLIKPRAEGDFSAGGRSGMAAWWDVTADVRSKRGDLEGATEAMAHTVDELRRVDAMPQISGVNSHNALAGALFRLSRAYAANDEPKAAMAAVSESDEIRKRIGLSPIVQP